MPQLRITAPGLPVLRLTAERVMREGQFADREGAAETCKICCTATNLAPRKTDRFLAARALYADLLAYVITRQGPRISDDALQLLAQARADWRDQLCPTGQS